MGKLCVGKRACLLPTLLHYIKEQIQQLEEVDEEEPVPGGKFHMPPFVVQQVPCTPALGPGLLLPTAVTFAPDAGGALAGFTPGTPAVPSPGAVGNFGAEQLVLDSAIDMDPAKKRKAEMLALQKLGTLDDPDGHGPDADEWPELMEQLGEEGDPQVQQKLMGDIAKSGKGSASSSSSSSSGDAKRANSGPSVAEVTMLMEQARKEAEDAARTFVLPKVFEVLADGDPAVPCGQQLG